MMKFICCRAAPVIFLLCIVVSIAATGQTFTSLFAFDGANGANPQYMSLVQGADGNLYGTTSEGGNISCNNSDQGCGTVFRITPNGTLTTIHVFCSGSNCDDGAVPYGGLVLGTDGNLYGTTLGGGADTQGTVFKISSNGRLQTLHSFNGTDGAEPYDTLIQAADGNFYGTTYFGGANHSGTVFTMTPQGTLATLYSFCSQFECADGAFPVGGLVQAIDGDFYGTTEQGGASDNGTVFKITSSGMFSTLHTFEGANEDGSYPYGGLVQASNAGFYGTTQFRGKNGEEGTIFKITSAGILTTLDSFNGSNGASPYDTLIQGTDGNLYGTTAEGGAGGGYGTIFSMALGGKLTTLYLFASEGGAHPTGGLIQLTNGIFYGTTRDGGNSACFEGCGTVFSLDVGLSPFVAFARGAAKSNQQFGILGEGLTGTTAVSLNGTLALFTVKSDTFIEATVPAVATTGYVTVTAPSGTLTSNKPFVVIP